MKTATEVIEMQRLVMPRGWAGISLFAAIVVSLAIGFLLGQTKGRYVHEQKFKIDPFDLLLEAECPNEPRGIYVVHWLNDRNKPNGRIRAKVKLLLPLGSRPRWSPHRNYILYERYRSIHVMDRKGNVVSQRGWMGNFPVYGWGPDDNAILIGTERSVESDIPGLSSLGFKTLWKEPWEKWKRDHLGEPIGHPGWGGITFSHHKLSDEWWLGAPTMSPDWSMHAFEAYRPISNYGRSYSKIYVVKWVEPPEEKVIKSLDYLPIWRLTNLPDDLLEVNPKWSLDGKWIAFEVIDSKASTHRVYVATPDGKVIKPILLPFQEPNIPDLPLSKITWESNKRYYEGHVRYTIVKWLKGARLLTRLERMGPSSVTENSVEFWLVDLEEKHRSKLFRVDTNVGLVAFNNTGDLAVAYNFPSPYHLGASLKAYDLSKGESYEVEGFPEDMIVYWMDW